MDEQQIIIFEGIDMVGKTTIAKALSRDIEIPYYAQKHNSKWHDPAIDIMYGEESRVQMLEQIGLSVILDRSYPSEFAYAKAYNRQLFEERIWELDYRYSELGAIIIYCYKDNDKWLKDKTNLIDFEKYSLIESYYEQFMSRTQCKSLWLDTSNQSLNDQICAIEEIL